MTNNSDPIPLRIFIVEDEPITAEDIEYLLINCGYTVVGNEDSGKKAYQKILETMPDLVLMDIKLKGKTDGVEVAALVREGFDIPIVYLTAYADNETLERAKYTQPYGYILKPFEKNGVKAAVEMALYKHKIEKQHKQLAEKDSERFEQLQTLVKQFIEKAQ
jgi:AmiR/NasT family two-component response regulator